MDMKFARGLTAMALSFAAAAASAQTPADLRNDAATPGDVTTYGMGWSLQRHTPLKQITPANVKKLAPVWNLSLDNSTNASNQPLVIDGVMYVASHTHTIAIDAVTGRQKWKTRDRAAHRHRRLPVLRHPHARHGGTGRRALPHHHRRPRDGHLDGRRQDDLEAEGRRVQGRLLDDACAADRRRRADHRHLRRRVRLARLSRRLGPEDRREEVAPLDHRRARRARRRHLEGRRPQDRRRTDLADRQLRPRARTSSTGAWATAARGTRRRAAAIRSTSARCSRSSRPPARSSGTTSSRPATRTTTTAPTSWCWPTCRSTASRPRC